MLDQQVWNFEDESKKLKQFQNVAKFFGFKVKATHITYTLTDNVMNSTNYDCTPLVKVDLDENEQKIKVAILHRKSKIDFFPLKDAVSNKTIILQIAAIDKDNKELINIMKLCDIKIKNNQWTYYSNKNEDIYGSLNTYKMYTDRDSIVGGDFKIHQINNLEYSWKYRIFPEN